MSDVKKYESCIEKEDHRTKITHGDYSRFEPMGETVLSKYFTPNNIYIITGMDYHAISGDLHNLTLHIPKHETSYSDSQCISFKDFELHFTYVAPETAEKERRELLDDFESQVKEIQSEMQMALSNPESIYELIRTSSNEEIKSGLSEIDFSIPVLPSPEHNRSNEHTIIPLVNGQSVDVVRRQLLNQKALGEVVGTYSKVKSNELSQVISFSASILTEKAQAVQGQARFMQDSVNGVMSKVDMLNLYLGEGVDCFTLIDKPESTSKAKINFFCHKIYADEEMLTHSLFSDGEFDYTNDDHFFKRLADEPEFLERILPTERSVICFQSRRNKKDYGGGLGDLIANRKNRSVGLLIRDGQRVSCIYSPIDYQDRLFPTLDEMNSQLDNVIDADDTELTDAQKKIESLNQMYSKVAAIFQGIIDRQSTGEHVVFGALAEEAYGASLFTPELIAKNINLINDEDFLIGGDTVAGSPRKWLSSHLICEHKINDFIVFNAGLITPENAKGLYYFSLSIYNDFEPRLDYDADDYFSVLSVSASKESISVNVPTTYSGNSDKMADKKVARVSINPERTENMLNLMSIRLSELETILSSRVARPTIRSRMQSLMTAYVFLKNLNEETLSLRNELQDRLPELNNDDLLLLILKWLSKNTKARSTLALPSSKLITSIAKLAQDSYHVEASFIDTVEFLASEHNKKLLFIASNGRDLVVGVEATTVYDLPYQSRVQDQHYGYRFPDYVELYSVIDNQWSQIGLLTDELLSYRIVHVFSSAHFSGISLEDVESIHKQKGISRIHLPWDTDKVELSPQELLEQDISQYVARLKSEYVKRSYTKDVAQAQKLSQHLNRGDNLSSSFLAMYQEGIESTDDNTRCSSMLDLMDVILSSKEISAYKKEYSKYTDVHHPTLLLPTRLIQKRSDFSSLSETHWEGMAIYPIRMIVNLYHSLSDLLQFEHKSLILNFISSLLQCRQVDSENILSKSYPKVARLVRSHLSEFEMLMIVSIRCEALDVDISQWLIESGFSENTLSLFDLGN
uniref:Uncharacterized protein n=1 Tax=Aliivibrio wodanis TaxID=80852 RepID=A0A5Q4ZYN2_9GAMM|nr:hypothetical protein [Aliivibrio wodanis]VVV06969.1 hypothetical protein AW0309160_04463 [Aliivibrio wodanis]